ncbi:copper amine oxidase N-terminal domain-containing protein [Paenibacillus tarimensis]
MMKKWVIGIVIAGFTLGIFPYEYIMAATKLKSDMPIEVLFDGRKIQFDVKPKMVQNTVLVPIRFVSEKLEAKLSVNGKQITITKDKNILKLTMNSNAASFNGKAVTLIQPAIVDNGRTLVPLRAISEGLGVKVEWDQVTKFVWIGKKIVPELRDILEPVNAEPYKKYFEGREFYFKSVENYEKKTAEKAYIITEKHFPFSINGEHFYRYDMAYDLSGTPFIKATTTDKGSMATQIYYIGKTSKLRYRASAYGYQVNIGDFRIHYYNITEYSDLISIGDENYDKYKIQEADYIGIAADYDGLILIQNPFK